MSCCCTFDPFSGAVSYTVEFRTQYKEDGEWTEWSAWTPGASVGYYNEDFGLKGEGRMKVRVFSNYPAAFSVRVQVGQAFHALGDDPPAEATTVYEVVGNSAEVDGVQEYTTDWITYEAPGTPGVNEGAPVLPLERNTFYWFTTGAALWYKPWPAVYAEPPD